PRLYPQWVLVLLVAFACASVSVLGNGGWREVLTVLPASGLAYWLHRRMGGWQLNHLATVLISAAVASGLYVGFAELLTLALGEPSPRTAAGFISACIFLIPGFPLVTAGLDLTRIDLQAGVPRLAYAAMVLLAITIGVWLVASLAGLSPDPVPPLDGHPAWLWVATVLAGFFAVFGWAAMFNSPFTTAVASGVIAALGAVLKSLMEQAAVRPHVAAFVACFVMGLACALVARWFGMTKIIMTVPVLLVTIPGSSALRTLLYFDQSDVVSAMQSGVSTVLVAIGMIAGLSGARMLTDPEWAFTRPEPPTLALAKVRRLLAFRRPTRRSAKEDPEI
ncbi:MAG: threonine/serine exporter family protein, partial [Propionibacteriaceae bacterium]|nr:threonine/serine exporter family protein [Propionibacteriaceae bacterium]